MAKIYENSIILAFQVLYSEKHAVDVTNPLQNNSKPIMEEVFLRGCAVVLHYGLASEDYVLNQVGRLGLSKNDLPADLEVDQKIVEEASAVYAKFLSAAKAHLDYDGGSKWRALVRDQRRNGVNHDAEIALVEEEEERLERIAEAARKDVHDYVAALGVDDWYCMVGHV